MTCVIGLEDDGYVYMAADSAAVDIVTTEISDIDKIFIIDKFLIGGCGSFRNIQVINWFFNPPLRKKSVTLDIEYMVKQFLPSFVNCLKKHNCISFSEEDTGTISGQFLVGYNGKLYRIDPDLHVNRCRSGLDAIGSGELIAKGALAALKTHNSFEYDNNTLLYESLKVVTSMNPTIMPPYKFLTI